MSALTFGSKVRTSTGRLGVIVNDRGYEGWVVRITKSDGTTVTQTVPKSEITEV